MFLKNSIAINDFSKHIIEIGYATHEKNLCQTLILFEFKKIILIFILNLFKKYLHFMVRFEISEKYNISEN